MKRLTLALTLALLIGPSTAQAQIGTAFTYQGRLVDAGVPANGAFDFEFQLFTLATGGTGSSVLTLGEVNVANGLFTVTLDFGAAFSGSPRWLEIRVRPGTSNGGHTALLPRQQLTPSPNAVFSSTAGAVSGIVPVANGGTGSGTQNFVDLTTAQTVGGDKVFTSRVWVGGRFEAIEIRQNGQNVCDMSGNCGLGIDIVPIDRGGTGSSTQNFVDLTTAQTVGGDKTLSGNLVLGGSTSTAGNILKGANRFIHNLGGTFVGVNAGNLATTGGSNVGVGATALQASTSGDFNTGIGTNALAANTTGSNNTGVGYGANVSSGALTNATAIGSGALVNASNKVRLGNSAVTVIEGQVAYSFSSDRNAKENLREVDAQAVLEKLRGLDVTTWNYAGHDPNEFRHYGPMAQDFHAAFGRDEIGAIGTETTINLGDIMGVLMLGIKGLDHQVQNGQRTIEAQAAEIAALKRQLGAVADAVKSLATATPSTTSSVLASKAMR